MNLNIQLINGISDVEYIRPGQWVVIENVAHKVLGNWWDRHCQWWEMTLEGEREPHRWSNHTNLHTINVVVVL